MLVKICLKNSETEEVLELLHTRLEEEENGDLYYCLARVYKFIGDLDEYYENLMNALDNPYTLSYSKKALKQELEYVGGQIGRHEEIEPEKTIEEFDGNDGSEDDSESEFDEDDEEFDDDGEDETENEEEESEFDDDEEYKEFDDDEENPDEQYEEIPEYESEE